MKYKRLGFGGGGGETQKKDLFVDELLSGNSSKNISVIAH